MMAVAPEAVEWAYRLILGREPDAEAIPDHLAARDLKDLRERFLQSDEFRSQLSPPASADRYLDVESLPIEVNAPDGVIRQMLDGIAREWRRFGESEPHWSVLTHENFEARNIAGHLEAFYRSGYEHLPLILNPLRRSGMDVSRFGRILDFGCGVGRLSLALASIGDRVLGVDISEGHIRLAAERAEAFGTGHVDFLKIDQVSDLDGLRDFDLVVSLIVLQHNPPPIMAILLRKLLDALGSGGVAVVQFPTLIKNYSFAVDRYMASDRPAMEMHALPQVEAFRIIQDAGCRVLEVREDDWAGSLPGISQTFAVIKA